MNLIEEDFKKEKNKKSNKAATIILVLIVLVVLAIIGIVIYMAYIKSNTLRLTIDGKSNEKLKSILVFEDDGKIYLPIKESAKYFNYESYNGEYNDISEEQSKCFVQNNNEVANFTLGSNKIYKVNLSTKEYEYVYSENAVKAINGVLYASTDAIEKAFNISFSYEEKNKKITIYTMPYLIEYYKSKILDYGYLKISENFENQKAVLQNILIVKKDEDKNKFAAIDVKGNAILEPKYDDITYLSNTGDFLVKVDEKVGILSSKGEIKVPIIYKSIELMDVDTGLYLAKNENNKYGVIDNKGNIKIYIENDEIGIDISKFKENNIKNKYLLSNELIPARKDKKWGLYDVNGNQVVDYEYDSFGYIASNSKDAYSLLMIPDYNVLVACKDKKYTLISPDGKPLFDTVADDIYMVISGGEKHYYISANDKRMDAIKYLERIEIQGNNNTSNNKTNNNGNTNNNVSNNNNTNNNNTQNTTTNQNNATNNNANNSNTSGENDKNTNNNTRKNETE